MSGLPQFQSVFRIKKPDAATSNGSEPRVAKRVRQIASCSACRIRKLRCDRQVPCNSCVKRGDVTSCKYFRCGPNGREGHDKGSKDSEAQIRLQKLESMVTNLMQTTVNGMESRIRKPSPNLTADDCLNELTIHSCPESRQSASAGHLDVNGSETNYLGATHWVAILENIRDIQGVLEPDEEDGGENPPYTLPEGPDIVLDTNRSLSLTDVCNFLPARARVDSLLYEYFNAKYIKAPIIHNGRFLREYESFWADPSSVSLLWVSMLCSALHLGSRVKKATEAEEFDLSDNVNRPTFLTLAGLALVNGRYDKGKMYSVEALLLYGLCKYNEHQDRSTEAWMILGTSTRVAMKMGYHRDPRHLAKISSFEGEMRRRTFMVVETLDLLLSSQAGLPPVIHEDEYDTEPPSNLFDTDFDEDSTSLPPSRPYTDPTPMLYYCFKGRLARLVRRVFQHALALKTRSYDETMRLDKELHDTNQEVPPSLRMRPLSSSIMDEAHMILNRLNIDLIYLRSLCILHREYLNHERSNPIFDYSRKTCVDAALRIMSHQADIHFACQPGGQFHNDRWMLSSIQLQDFLIAAMIICLDLYESNNRSTFVSPEDITAQVRKYDAVKLSHEIWMTRRSISRDARRACKVLAAMLSKVPRPGNSTATSSVSRQDWSISESSNGEDFPTGTSANSSGTSSGYINGFDIPGEDLPNDMPSLPDVTTLDPLSSLFNECDNIDWVGLDCLTARHSSALNITQGLVDQCLTDRGEIGDVTLDWQNFDVS